MTEDPIRLFSKRSERYPLPNEIDATRSVLEKIAEQVPILGSATVHVLSQFLVPGVERRREEWFKELADDVDHLEETVEGFKTQNLANNENFVSATIQASRIAIATHQQEKREMLRNALIQIATGKGPGDDLEHIFLTSIEEFTPSHVKVLYVLWAGVRDLSQRGLWNQARERSQVRTYGQAMQALFPELGADTSLLEYMLRDLSRKGFAALSDPNASFPQGSLVSNIGIRFLQFVIAP